MSEILVNLFERDSGHTRLVFGIQSLPLGLPLELELVFAITPDALVQ